MSNKTLVIICGPTAVGKTDFAVSLAKQFNSPIISADSRQFFKELNIGSAKPTLNEMQNIPHHFIDSHSIFDDYNVGKYENEAIALIEQLFKKHSVLVLVGGSGLYIDAITKGFDALPEADKNIRKQIDEKYKNEGIEALQKLLKELDPEYYKIVDLNNPQRLSRALEVCLTTGKTYSDLRKHTVKKREFKSIKIGLNLNREALYKKINLRVDEMIKKGLVEEVKSLYSYKHLNALQTVGYKELFDYFENKISLNEAIEKIKQNTRNFAKRQLTWFRRDEEIKWFESPKIEDVVNYINKS